MRWPHCFRFWLIITLLVLQGPSRMWADGRVFSPELAQEEAWIPDQRALLHWMDGQEVLVIETSVANAGSELGWVVPVPSEPVVEAAPADLFQGLAEVFGPHVKLEPPIFLLSAAVLVLWGMRWPGGWLKKLNGWWRWGISLSLPPVLVFIALSEAVEPVSGFLGAVMAFFLCCAVMERGRLAGLWSMRMLWIVLAGGVAWMLFFIQGKMMGGASSNPAGVEVVSIRNAGTFQATTLRAGYASALSEWLVANGYALAPAARPAIDAYVREGWFFVAMKVRREAGEKTGALHPVTFRFASEKPVYPMRLTAGGTRGRPLTLDLFVMGPESAAVPGMKARRSSVIAGEHQSPEIFRRTLMWPDITRWFGGATMATWLRGDIPADQLTHDVIPAWTGTQIQEPVVTSWGSALSAALNRALPVLTLAALLLRGGRAVRGNMARVMKGAAACGALSGLVWGAIRFSELEKVWVKEIGDFPHRRLSPGTQRVVLRFVKQSAVCLREKLDHADGPRPAFNAAGLGEALGDLVDEEFLQLSSSFDKVTRYPALVIFDTGNGAEAWYAPASQRRLFVAGWDFQGNEDRRLGRSPLWENPWLGATLEF